jgi:hypothetical protein
MPPTGGAGPWAIASCEHEGLRTGQGSEGQNLRNSGRSTGHPRTEDTDIRGIDQRQGQRNVPIRPEAPGEEGLLGCQPGVDREGSNDESREDSANGAKKDVSEA